MTFQEFLAQHTPEEIRAIYEEWLRDQAERHAHYYDEPEAER